MAVAIVQVLILILL